MFVHFSKPVISVKKAVELIQFLAEGCATKSSSQLTLFLLNWHSSCKVLFASQSFRISFRNIKLFLKAAFYHNNTNSYGTLKPYNAKIKRITT